MTATRTAIATRTGRSYSDSGATRKALGPRKASMPLDTVASSCRAVARTLLQSPGSAYSCETVTSYRPATMPLAEEKSRRPRVAHWAANPKTAPQTAPITSPPMMRPIHSGPVVNHPTSSPMNRPHHAPVPRLRQPPGRA